MDNMEFGDHLRKVRRSKGFRYQKDLAELSGVSQTTISRIEDGTQTPNEGTLKKLADALSIDYTGLMTMTSCATREEKQTFGEYLQEIL